VTQTDSTVPDNHARSFAARLAWIALILATLYICYFHNLGAIGLVGPDEPRYAWIARDMAETGDWVTPRLYGKPWFEKPALYYWGAALCFKLFGVSEVAARLPSAISALLATLAMAWLARRVYGAETTRWLLLLLPTTIGMIGFSHAAAPDMPFAAMLTVAMVFAAKLVGVVPASGSLSFASFTSSSSFISSFLGFFIGLAVLAKGPAAIILSGGGVLLWALFTKRWRDAFRCLHPIGIASFCLTVLPWYILCARRNPGFFRIFIIEHNFKRYLTPEFQHIQPFWFYVPILLVGVLPWTLLLLFTCLPELPKLRRQRLGPNTSALFLICWSLVPLLFFSASKSKLPGYILPVVPALGVFLGKGMTSVRTSLRRSAVVSLLLSAFTFGVMALALFGSRQLLRRFPDAQPALAVLFGALALTFGLLGLALRMKTSSYAQRLLTIGGLVIFLLVVALLGNSETLRGTGLSSLSAKGVAKAVHTYAGTPENLRLVGLSRSTHYQLAFYLHSELSDWRGDRSDGDLLLGKNISCSQLKLSTGCVDLWGSLDMPGNWALLEISSPTQ
jgi:4-amino-4-deoxy-L-arabinose transferase-like glycosyltransferase